MPWLNRLVILIELCADNISLTVRELMRRAIEPNRYFLARNIKYGSRPGGGIAGGADAAMLLFAGGMDLPAREFALAP